MSKLFISHFHFLHFLKIINSKKLIFVTCFVSPFLFGQKEFHPEYEEVLDRVLKVIHYETKDNIDSLNSVLHNSGNACLQTLSVHYDASYEYLIKNNLNEAEKKSLECLRLADVNKSKMHTACYESAVRISATRLFYLYRRKGEFQNSLNVILNQKKIFKSYEISNFQAINDFDMENYEVAILGFKKSLSGILSESNPQNLPAITITNFSKSSNIYQSIADAFLEIYKNAGNVKLLDSANYYYKKAYVDGNKFNGNKDYNSALYYSKLAKTEFYRGNYKNSIKYYNTFFNHEIMHENSFTYQSYCIGLAQNYLELNQPDQSLKYLSKLDSAYALNPGSEQFYIAGLSVYMDAYQQKGNDKKALEYAKLYLENIQKIAQNKIKARDVMNIMNIDESTEKANEILNPKSNWALFLGGFGVLALSVFLFFKFKPKKKFQSVDNEIEEISIPTIADNFTLENEIKDFEKPKIQISEETIIQMKKRMADLEKNKEFLKKEFKLSYMAKKLHTNTSYLSSFFNESIGKNFNQYLQEKRMEYLIELLETNPLYRKYTVQAISEHIGYKSPSAFSKMFKQHTRISYTAFLKQIEDK